MPRIIAPRRQPLNGRAEIFAVVSENIALPLTAINSNTKLRIAGFSAACAERLTPGGNLPGNWLAKKDSSSQIAARSLAFEMLRELRVNWPIFVTGDFCSE